MGHSVPTQGDQQQTRLQKSTGKMQLEKASAHCVKQSLAQQKPGLSAALATISKIKHSPGKAQPLPAHGEKMGAGGRGSPLPETQLLPASPSPSIFALRN